MSRCFMAMAARTFVSFVREAMLTSSSGCRWRRAVAGDPATCAPCLASAMAMAWPEPRLAPVTSAVVPASWSAGMTESRMWLVNLGGRWLGLGGLAGHRDGQFVAADWEGGHRDRGQADSAAGQDAACAGRCMAASTPSAKARPRASATNEGRTASASSPCISRACARSCRNSPANSSAGRSVTAHRPLRPSGRAVRPGRGTERPARSVCRTVHLDHSEVD
jgi:hypothetical protein